MRLGGSPPAQWHSIPQTPHCDRSKTAIPRIWQAANAYVSLWNVCVLCTMLHCNQGCWLDAGWHTIVLLIILDHKKDQGVLQSLNASSSGSTLMFSMLIMYLRGAPAGCTGLYAVLLLPWIRPVLLYTLGCTSLLKWSALNTPIKKLAWFGEGVVRCISCVTGLIWMLL